SGFGALAGTGGFTNVNFLSQSGGNLVLANSGPNLNTGTINLAPGSQFQLTGSGQANGGALNLNGSLITGPAGLTNSAGGTLVGPGSITAPFANPAGVIAAQGGALNISQPFTSGGAINLGGPAAVLGGALITNTGSVQ